jgi:TolC family type I secretion outer membrane protein
MRVEGPRRTHAMNSLNSPLPGPDPDHSARWTRCRTWAAPATLGITLALQPLALHAQAVTTPVLPSATTAPEVKDIPPATLTLPTATLGEAQLDFLLKQVQDLSRPERGMPIEAFRDKVQRAVLVHPDVLTVRATYAGALESTRELGAASRPQVGARVDAATNRLDRNTISGNPKREYETASAGLTLTQNLYDFGAVDTAVTAGVERSTAIRARLDGRRDEVALRAVQAWHDVIRSRRQLAQARLNLQALDSLVAYLTRRFDLGGGPVSDIWRAQSRLADAKASVSSLQSRVRASESAYREVFDTDPGPIELPVLPAVDRRAIGADPARLAREFPAVRAAEANRRAAEHELDLTVRRERPTVGLELNAQRRDLIGAGASGTDLTAMVVMRYSFYSGGADQARAGQAAHRAVEAAEQVRSLSLQVERALGQALATEENASAVLSARREGVVLAAQALRAVREQFANRRGSLLDLLNSQESLHAAGVGLTDAEVDESLARWQTLYYTTAYWPLAISEATKP